MTRSIRKVNPASVRNLKRGGSPGRPKGVPNKATREVKELAKSIVEDPEYRKKLQTALRKRKGIAPAVEVMLWHYAYGKPKEEIDLKVIEAGVIVIEERLGDGA